MKWCCHWFQLSFSGTVGAECWRCCLPLCPGVFVLLCLILQRIGYGGLCPSAGWDFLETRDTLRIKRWRTGFVLWLISRKVKSSPQHEIYSVCVRLRVCAQLNFKCIKQWVQCDSFTCTRPQASVSFPLRFDIQKMYCPNKPLIFILLLTGWISVKLTVFGVLAFFSPPPRPRLRADRSRSKFSGASCLSRRIGEVQGG